MTARRFAYTALFGTVAATGWYFFAYLTRWEWNRAIISALIFLAAELALLGALVLDRIGRLRGEIAELRDRRDVPPARATRPEILAHVRDAAPEPDRPFEWLDPDRTTVFIPVLLGAGVIVSALAWAVERLARFTAGASLERDLARRLSAVALPRSLLVTVDDSRAPRWSDAPLDTTDAAALLRPTASGT
ncbi:MAG TPA: hypothetical protein VFZ83_15695 [Acidimicrobiia bacterium]|nr:hypothetical protein [Acidimicrobiia bacterium]